MRTRENLAHYLERMNVNNKILTLPGGCLGVIFDPAKVGKVIKTAEALGFIVINPHEYRHTYGDDPGADLILF